MHLIKSNLYLFLIIFSVACSNKKTSHTTTADLARPNIILFVADDHGTDAIGAYGNAVIKTPNMDRLAREGVRFDRAYCTSASCAASRSVILTGLYGHASGSYGHTHDYHHFSTFDQVQSLPVMLQVAGYQTARIGKYHLAPESVYRFGTVLEEDERSAVAMAEKCKSVISGEDPFFLYFCTGDPHRGNPFTPDVWSDPNNFGNRSEGYPGVLEEVYSPDEVIVPPFLPDTKESRAELAQYYQSVSRIDQGLGKLMQLLEEEGKADDTIIIYISDNGIAFPGAKTTLYEPGIKLPCIVKDPTRSQKGIVNQSMISWVDLTPTILDMAKVEYDKEQFHGRSFDKILTKEKDEMKRNIYASHTFHEITMYYPMRAVRSGDYKLIWNATYQLPYPFASDLWASSTWQGIYREDVKFFGKRTVDDYLHRAEFELYDLASDPDEVNNLALSEVHATLLEEMKTKLKDFQRKTKDPWYILWDHDPLMQGTGVKL
ncbi:sulfatase [Reichenbachiella carrageenanivorans]|uniref:Sulfatase n=1 Tax=Reichenbachiella carrageenanivorans TaxID=2979869 RepID=A0ABY6CZP3_9BACT|nr:sulfatase [Reichenbachiella carrageenanivorans]UXX79372.1 sulfatase [Reichenbachiella carrageenanivorans]